MRRLLKVVSVVVVLAATALVGSQVEALQCGEAPSTQAPPPVTPRDTGGGITESRFVPLQPCRVYDTRQGSGNQPIGAGNFRIAKVRGPEDFAGQFAAQGGKPGGCGVPPTAVAVEATLTAVSATGTGFVRAWASGQPEPAAAFLNYIKGFNASNTGAIAICNVSCGQASDMRVRVLNASTHLAIDVQGYYVKPMAAVVNSNGALVLGSRVISTSRPLQGQYLVKFDRTLDQCVYNAAVDGLTGNGYAMVGVDSADNTRLYVFTSDASGALQNRGFHLTVTC